LTFPLLLLDNTSLKTIRRPIARQMPGATGPGEKMNEPGVAFELEMKVRDYEVDLQGIVNNAVYQHYLEHARHEFLISRDIDFAALHAQGKDLVVARIEIDYRSPLKSRDKFKVTLRVKKEGPLKVVFAQTVVRLPDNKVCIEARVTGICLKSGRPARPEDVLDISRLGLQ
jgi:acyl-CoA thioester hydrolase